MLIGGEAKEQASIVGGFGELGSLIGLDNTASKMVTLSDVTVTL